MTPEQIAAEMRANPDAAHAIAIGHIRAIMRPGQTSATAGMSTGAKLAAVEDVLAALDEAEGNAPASRPITPPRIDSEESARAAFAHIEDDDNEWGGA